MMQMIDEYFTGIIKKTTKNSHKTYANLNIILKDKISNKLLLKIIDVA